MLWKPWPKEPDEALDCLIAFDLIEHFNRNELISLVDEVHRVLRSEGRWIIHTANAESPFGMRSRYGDHHPRAGLHPDLTFPAIYFRPDFPDWTATRTNQYRTGPKALFGGCSGRLFAAFYASTWRSKPAISARDAIFSQNFLAVAFK